MEYMAMNRRRRTVFAVHTRSMTSAAAKKMATTMAVTLDIKTLADTNAIADAALGAS
jgi:hypothetical protein